jgi:hypothetical protein
MSGSNRNVSLHARSFFSSRYPAHAHERLVAKGKPVNKLTLLSFRRSLGTSPGPPTTSLISTTGSTKQSTKSGMPLAILLKARAL